jgi:hypothetical protein
VENSDVGMNVFGMFLYMASPSLPLCLFGVYQNNNYPATFKERLWSFWSRLQFFLTLPVDLACCPLNFKLTFGNSKEVELVLNEDLESSFLPYDSKEGKSMPEMTISI